VAAGLGDGSVALWDLKTSQPKGTLSGHDKPVVALAFNPDGSILASGSVDQTIRLWDIAKAETLVTLSGNSNIVYSVAFSPDGTLLASGSDTIRLWGIVNSDGAIAPSPVAVTTNQVTATVVQSANNSAKVTGVIKNKPNLAVALFRQRDDGRFILSVDKDTLQTHTDGQGNFTFSNVQPGRYVIFEPKGDGFGLFKLPANPALVVGYGPFPQMWIFEVKKGQTVDPGTLTS
jgi:WD40 repeat protein